MNIDFTTRYKTKKGVNGRFKTSDKLKKHFQSWDSAVHTSEKQLNPNSTIYRHRNSLVDVDDEVDARDYKLQTYKNNFLPVYQDIIGSQKVFKLRIARMFYMEVHEIRKAIGAVYTSWKKADKDRIRLEKLYVDKQLARAEKFFKTHSYT